MNSDYLTKIQSIPIAFYDDDTNTLTSINAYLENEFKCKSLQVKAFSRGNGSIYGTCHGIPVQLKIISENGITVVEVFLAPSKTLSQTSFFMRMADLATDGFWCWYPLLNYEFMSSRFWSILGYDQTDMAESPTSWKEKIDPDDCLKAEAIFDQHVQSKGVVPYYLTAKYRHREGHVVHVVCRGSVEEWLPDGRPWKVMGTHTDITDIVLKDALVAREKFVSRMSHEIRTPLCAVVNECDLLANKYDLSEIKDACSQILYISNNVLDLDKMRTGEVKINTEPCDSEQLMLKTIKRHRPEFKKKGVKLSLSMDEMPPQVSLDRTKFNQIVDNLLSNALKYTQKGQVSVESDYDTNKTMFTVVVKDTGTGIPKDEHDKVFDEFYQGSSSMRGIGIGLYVASVMCKTLGGFIEIEESIPGEGTSMKFGVRAEVVYEDKDEKEKTEALSLRILVVDDISTNRKYLTRKIHDIESKFNLVVNEIVEASDGKDAIRLFEKSEDPFDLILMDCLMPIVDGFQATQSIHRICDQRGVSRVPVVAVTGSVASDINKKCEDAGMMYVVTKPFSSKDLETSLVKIGLIE